MNQIKFFATVQFLKWGHFMPPREENGKKSESSLHRCFWKGENHGDNKTPIRNETETYQTGP